MLDLLRVESSVHSAVRQPMQITFRKTLIAYTLIIVVIAAAGTSLYTIGSSRRRAVLAFDESCSSSVRLAAVTLASEVEGGDIAALRTELDRLLEVGGLKAVGVFHEDGEPLVQVRSGSLFHESFPALRDYKKSPGEIRSLYQHNQLRVTSPIHAKGGQFLGFLACDFSMLRVYAGQWQLTISTLCLTGLVVALSAVLAVALSWKVIGPIRRMIQVTEQISRRRFDVRVRSTRQQELNSLAQTINGMAEQLEKTTVSKDYVSSIVESMWDGLLVVDGSGAVHKTNPAASRLFARPEAELIGASIDNLLLTLSGSPYDPMDLLIDQLPEGVDGYAVNLGPEPTPVSISSAPIEEQSGERRQFVVVLKDITVRKQTENALDHAIRDARRASQVKSEFLANMSHELRTPMNSIIGFTKRLIGKLAGEISERHMDALATVERNAQHLLGLINDILDLSKIEAGQMDLKRTQFDLALIAKDVVRQNDALLDGKPITLHVNAADKVEIVADRIKVVQIATNLLSNAIKYTDEGTIEMSVSAQVDSDGAQVAELQVKDTGVGIEEEGLKRLFRKFAQLDGSPTRSAGGTGSGLYITMQYVEMHGGRMRVESKVGEGSTFTVTLPLQQQDSQQQLTSQQQQPSQQQQSCQGSSEKPMPTTCPSGNGGGIDEIDGVLVLCIDDDDDSRRLLKLTLEEQSGYQVISANGFDSAIALASAHKPDLICLDLNMPRRNGVEVKEALAANPVSAGIPIISVSSEGDHGSYGEHDGDWVLTKPFDTNRMLAIIQNAIMASITSILFIEGDPDSRALFERSFLARGIRTKAVADGKEGLDQLGQCSPTAVILDLDSSPDDALAFLHSVRANAAFADLPVIVLAEEPIDPKMAPLLSRQADFVLDKKNYTMAKLIATILMASKHHRHHVEVLA